MVSGIMDAVENLFIRYCKYNGQENWKEAILAQICLHMHDKVISECIINGQLRFFEVTPEKYPETD